MTYIECISNCTSFCRIVHFTSVISRFVTFSGHDLNVENDEEIQNFRELLTLARNDNGEGGCGMIVSKMIINLALPFFIHTNNIPLFIA